MPTAGIWFASGCRCWIGLRFCGNSPEPEVFIDPYDPAAATAWTPSAGYKPHPRMERLRPLSGRATVVLMNVMMCGRFVASS